MFKLLLLLVGLTIVAAFLTVSFNTLLSKGRPLSEQPEKLEIARPISDTSKYKVSKHFPDHYQLAFFKAIIH